MTTEPRPKTRTYLISDLHLEASRPRLTRAFKHFLNSIAADVSALYILGDFVEAWIGDDDNSAFNADLKATLAKFVKDIAPIYFIHGNRDFLIGERFCRETGVVTLPECTRAQLHGKNILLLHGDSLCTDDEAYQRFRNKVRDPSWQKKMLGYPLLLRKLIASYLRFRSRKANRQKASAIMDVSISAVQSAFRKHGVNIMIHGHTHRPDTHVYTIDDEPCERIVLGDWGESIWYVVIAENEIGLKRKSTASFATACDNEQNHD